MNSNVKVLLDSAAWFGILFSVSWDIIPHKTAGEHERSDLGPPPDVRSTNDVDIAEKVWESALAPLNNSQGSH